MINESYKNSDIEWVGWKKGYFYYKFKPSECTCGCGVIHEHKIPFRVKMSYERYKDFIKNIPKEKIKELKKREKENE